MATLEQEIVLTLQQSPLWTSMPENEKTALFWHAYLLWIKFNAKSYFYIN